MQLRTDELSWHVAGDEIVILDLQGSVYLQLNGSARVLWERLVDGATEDELRAALVERYGIDDGRASADVAAFVADLRARRLLAA